MPLNSSVSSNATSDKKANAAVSEITATATISKPEAIFKHTPDSLLAYVEKADLESLRKTFQCPFNSTTSLHFIDYKLRDLATKAVYFELSSIRKSNEEKYIKCLRGEDGITWDDLRRVEYTLHSNFLKSKQISAL